MLPELDTVSVPSKIKVTLRPSHSHRLLLEVISAEMLLIFVFPVITNVSKTAGNTMSPVLARIRVSSQSLFAIVSFLLWCAK
jgi:hypothetical protein